jgi:hypothetical protein
MNQLVPRLFSGWASAICWQSQSGRLPEIRVGLLGFAAKASGMPPEHRRSQLIDKDDLGISYRDNTLFSRVVVGFAVSSSAVHRSRMANVVVRGGAALAEQCAYTWTPLHAKGNFF